MMADERISEVLVQLLLDSQQMLMFANAQQWESLFELQQPWQQAFADLESLVQAKTLDELPDLYLESMQQLSRLNQQILAASQVRQQELTGLLSRLHQGSKAASAYSRT